MIVIRLHELFPNNTHVNIQKKTQSKKWQTCTNRFYGYLFRAPSALIATGLVRPVLLGSLVRCPLAVRIGRRVFSVLKLRTGCTALEDRADHCGISFISPTLNVYHNLWTVSHCDARKECNRDITRRSLHNTFANGSVSLRLPIYG